MRDRPPHVLVAYGSKRGGTREIAEVIAEELLNAGIDTELADAAVISNLTAYDAVVVGGALYMNRWHGDARRLLTHHAAELRARPVWMFSSGPLDDSANQHALPAPHQVDQLAHRIGAREHVVFGGRVPPEGGGPAGRAMAKNTPAEYRDRRDWDEIREWARHIAAALAVA
jgi:menaquinone-dependent protoporphyrinogen oxidase